MHFLYISQNHSQKLPLLASSIKITAFNEHRNKERYSISRYGDCAIINKGERREKFKNFNKIPHNKNSFQKQIANKIINKITITLTVFCNLFLIVFMA